MTGPTGADFRGVGSESSPEQPDSGEIGTRVTDASSTVAGGPVPVRVVLREAARQLETAGVASPVPDAQRLAAFVLKLSQGEILRAVALDSAIFDAAALERFRDLVDERSRRVPLQHLTGTAPFRELELAVGPGVFVPRPETELLVSWGLEREPKQLVDLCSGSGAVALSEHVFVIADDEDNVLRAYDTQAPGAPLWMVDVSAGLGVHGKPAKPGKPPKGAPETDIEAATRLGDVALWLTSHGRNSSAKAKPERLRLFGTNLPAPGEELRVVGAYEKLLDDLFADARLARFGLRQAAELAPKEKGGLNLEGMTRRREGGVWIGFRNPIPDNKALLVPLLNPEAVLQGSSAQLGEPRLLDLGGRGIRSLSNQGERYLVMGGAFDSSPGSRLYTWDGVNEPEPSSADLSGLNPEGFVTPSGSSQTLVVSDDGAELVNGIECKRLTDPSQKRFRARFVTP